MSLPVCVLKTASSYVEEIGAPTVPTTGPSAPQNVVVVAGTNFLGFTVSPPASPNNSPVSGYEFSITDPSSVVTTILTGAPQLSVQFTGLPTNTTYTYSIAAVNAHGAGTPATGTTATNSASTAFDPRAFFAPLINGTGEVAAIGPAVDPATMTHYSTKGILYAGTGSKAVAASFSAYSIDGDSGEVSKIYSTGGTKGSFGTGNETATIASFTDCNVNTNVSGQSGNLQFTRCTISPSAASQNAFSQSDSGGATMASVSLDHCLVNGIIDASDPGADCLFQYTAFQNAAPEPIFAKLWAGGLPGSSGATQAGFIPIAYCQSPYLQDWDPSEVITQGMLDAGPVLRRCYSLRYTDPATGKTDSINNHVFLQCIGPGKADTTGASPASVVAPHNAYFKLKTGDDSNPFVFNGGVASTDSSGTGGQAVPGTYSGTGAIWISQSGLSHADGLQWGSGGRCEAYRCYFSSPSNAPIFIKCSSPNNPTPTTGVYVHECLLDGGYNWWALLQHVNGPTNPNTGNTGPPGGFYRNPSNPSQFLPFTSKLGAIQPRAVRFENNWWGPAHDGVTYPSQPINDGYSAPGEHINFVSTVAAYTDAVVRQYSGYSFTTLQKTEIGEGIFDWAPFETANYVLSGGVTTCPVLDQGLMGTRYTRYGYDGMCDARNWVISKGNVRADNGASVDPANYQDGL